MYSKRITAFFLLVSFMFSGTVAGELKKLPALVMHYNEHRQENRKMDLLSFLFMHYCTDDGTDKDSAADNKLPFKSAESPGNISVIYLAARPSVNIEKPFVVNSIDFFDPGDAFLSSLYLDSIWQPPRSC